MDGIAKLITGQSMIGPLEDESVFKYIVKDGAWEPHVTKLIMESLEPGDVFVDVGANLGYFTIIASRLVGASGAVHAFEPAPLNYNYIIKNIQLNALKNVQLHKTGLWNCCSTKKLTIPPKFYGGARIDTAGEIEISCIALDDLALAPNLIKIDIEGAEIFALEGIRRTIDTHHPKIIIELNRYWLKQNGFDPSAYIDFFNSVGYEMRTIPGDEPIKGADMLDKLCPSPLGIVDLIAQ